MSIDSLKSLLKDADPGKLLPAMDTVTGKLVSVLRLAILIGPICMLLFGLIFLFAAPKEANHRLGYRCFFGMGSQEAWSFSQRLGGVVWSALGLLLTIIMLIVGAQFGRVSADAMVHTALVSAGWELGLTLIATIGVNGAVMWFFDKDGNHRYHPTK